MARPKSSIENLKTFQINIRVTASEQILLEEYAKECGLSLVQYIRIRAMRRQLPKQKMPVADRELLITLSRISNNVNQITKKINQGNPKIDSLKVILILLLNNLDYIRKELLK